MSQLTASDGQLGNWEEPDFFLCRFETARFHAYGWQEPYDGRLSRTDLWERGGEIPLRHPTTVPPSSICRYHDMVSVSVMISLSPSTKVHA